MGTSEPPRDGACWFGRLRPSPLPEYRQIVSGTLKAKPQPGPGIYASLNSSSPSRFTTGAAGLSFAALGGLRWPER